MRKEAEHFAKSMSLQQEHKVENIIKKTIINIGNVNDKKNNK